MSSPVNNNIDPQLKNLQDYLKYVDPNNPTDPNSAAYINPSVLDASEQAAADDANPQSSKNLGRSLRNFGRVHGHG